MVESAGSFHRTDSRQDLGKSVGTLKLLDAAEKEMDRQTRRSLPVVVQRLEHHLNSEHFLSLPFVVCTLIICFYFYFKSKTSVLLLTAVLGFDLRSVKATLAFTHNLQ